MALSDPTTPIPQSLPTVGAADGAHAPHGFRKPRALAALARPLALFAGTLSLAASASAQDWTVSPNPGQSWIPERVHWAGADQFVWAGASGASPRHLLMRAHASPAGWIDRVESQFAASALSRRTAAGQRADRLFALEAGAGGVVTLRAYNPWTGSPGFAGAPVWSQGVVSSTSTGQPPAMELACDRSGERVFAALALPGTSGARVMGWSAQSGSPLFSVDVVGTGLDGLEVSADGQTLVVASGLHWTALNGQGQTISHGFVPSSLGDLSLSADGQVLAAGTLNGTRLWQRDAAGFFEVDWYATHAGQAFESLTAEVDLSDDGRYLALGHWRYLGSPSTAFEIWDTQTHSLLWQRLRPISNPARQDLPTQVEISSDGTRAVFGSWSDEVWPEVVHVEGVPTAQGTVWTGTDWDLPGSVRDLQLSRDGRRLAVAYKQGHAQTFGGTGHIQVLTLQPEELTWTAPARPGHPLPLRAQRSDAWFTLFLVGPKAWQPTVVGGVAGLLWVDRAQLSVHAAINDAQGVARWDWQAPLGWSGPTAPLAVQTAYRTPLGTILGDAVIEPLWLP